MFRKLKKCKINYIIFVFYVKLWVVNVPSALALFGTTGRAWAQLTGSCKYFWGTSFIVRRVHLQWKKLEL